MKTHMLKTLAGCSLLALSAATLAEPAIYRDGIMYLKSGAVIGTNAAEYYSDIEMTTDAEGKLKINKAKRLPLVYIDSVEATVLENTEERSVELAIAGNKSVPCVALADVAVAYKNKVFTVVVAETVQGPAESCIAVLAPFEIDVALDVSGLEAGTYTVRVNGEETSFELETDPLGAN